MDKKSYDSIGVHALPPRKKGRDRKRFDRNNPIIEMKNTGATGVTPTTQIERPMTLDPFSPLIEEFTHVPIPEGVVYDNSREGKYEFLDNTADIQIHSWGNSLGEAFENCVLGMFGYMTELTTVSIDLECSPILIKGKGHDCLSLLYDVMNEFLCSFHTQNMLIKDVRLISSLADSSVEDVRFLGFGEKYDPTKHPQGTEIKAITYSNMQIHEKEEVTHIYIILDI